MKAIKKHFAQTLIAVGLPLFVMHFSAQAVDQFNIASNVITDFYQKNG
ncbi:hypothetical protein [Pseudoxanthomonas winnipegensis]|nr:hypothetical protein [Pseudoxanthomonas winnipegensis]